jgi:hypothetical protein
MTQRDVPTPVLAFVPSLPVAPCWVSGRSGSDRVAGLARGDEKVAAQSLW